MSENLVISILTLATSIVSSMALVNWRLKKLEEKVDEHNGWGAKFQAQSTDIAVIKNDLSYIRKSIEKLEGRN